jgi:hypothetical protein
MAVPVRFAVDLLKKAGWTPPEEQQDTQNQTTASASPTPQTKTQ